MLSGVRNRTQEPRIRTPQMQIPGPMPTAITTNGCSTQTSKCEQGVWLTGYSAGPALL
jgi:hypothetical protein